MARRKKYVRSLDCPLYSWAPDRRATRNQIREAIRVADAQIERAIFLLNDRPAYNAQCGYVQRQAFDVATLSLKQAARSHLEYWRQRAFMRDGYGNEGRGDRPMRVEWDAFA